MKIEFYSFGNIVVNGTPYSKDLIILPGRIIPDWWRNTGHVFDAEDCREILSADPDLVVFGLGKFGLVRLAPELVQELEKRSIESKSASTAKAVKLFNELSVTRKTAGAFHLTC